MRKLFLLALLLTFPAPARAIGPEWPVSDTPRFWNLGERLAQLSFDSSAFYSTENYNGLGYSSQPPFLNRVTLLSSRLTAGFGIAPQLSVFGQLELRDHMMAASRAVSAPADQSHFGPGDAFLAFRWMPYRTGKMDNVYPAEWIPATIVTNVEGSGLFPLYGRAAVGQPPLGDQANDLTLLARAAWYANEWLALSGSLGYLYRTAGYRALLPWSLRADVSVLQNRKLRFWADLRSQESLKPPSYALNPTETDPIPNGSFLFKSYSPTLRTVHLGSAWLLSREWELAGAFFFTASGVNAAKGLGAALGLTWRPYEVPEIETAVYHREQVALDEKESHAFHSRDSVIYGYSATVVRVSANGNFLKILYGGRRAVIGDPFYIFTPDKLSTAARQPIGKATVVRSQPDAAFLHVDELSPDAPAIREGFEVRRVYYGTGD